MERVLNFRKLADGVCNNQGMVIKNIYRSADLNKATERDIISLKNYGINHIIDLRSASEIEKYGEFEQDGIVTKQITILDQQRQAEIENVGIDSMVDTMHKLYEHFFVESSGFEAELKYILSLQGAPFLFHCVAGKDRTGITGAILMHLLDFDFDSIMDEYLQIDYVFVRAVMTKVENELIKRNIKYDRENILALASIVPSFLEAYILGVTDKYGTIDNYIKTGLNINEADIEMLRSYYLTKP